MKLRKTPPFTVVLWVVFFGATMVIGPVPSLRGQGRPGVQPRRQDEAEKPSEEELRKLLEDAGIEKLGEGKYRLGKVILDSEERTVRVPAKVHVEVADQVELVACVPEGKTYETLTIIDAKGLHVQLALLLLNMDPGKNPAVDYRPDDPMAQRPDGHLVHVLLEWQPPGKEGDEELPPKRRERIEWFLKDVETGKPLPPAKFAFIGSLWLRGGFAADLDGTVIALYEDPGTVLELALERAHSIPWSAVIEDRALENGTKVDIIIADIPPDEGDPPEDGGTVQKAVPKEE